MNPLTFLCRVLRALVLATCVAAVPASLTAEDPVEPAQPTPVDPAGWEDDEEDDQ